MELQQLRCLVSVADHGTFTRAATALHVTQPALSHAISKLESEVKLQLFHRTARGVQLTSAGETLLGPARQALDAVENVDATVSALHGVTAGSLRVVAFRSFTTTAAEVAAAFRRCYPDITLHVSAPDTDDGVCEMVSSGACDLGFARLGHVPADVRARPVTEEELVVLLPPSLTGTIPDGPMTLRQAAELPHVAPPAGSVARMELDRIFAAAGLTIRVVVENAHHESSIAMVRSGSGICVTTRGRGIHEGNEPSTTRPITPARRSQVGVVWGKSVLSPAAAAFTEFADRYFAARD